MSSDRRQVFRLGAFAYGAAFSTRNVIGVVFSLIVSSILGLVIGGSQAGGPFVAILSDLLAICSMLLWPSCARRHVWSYPTAIGVAILSSLVAIAGLILDPANSLGEAVWAVVQIPVVYFALNGYRGA